MSDAIEAHQDPRLVRGTDSEAQRVERQFGHDVVIAPLAWEAVGYSEQYRSRRSYGRVGNYLLTIRHAGVTRSSLSRFFVSPSS